MQPASAQPAWQTLPDLWQAQRILCIQPHYDDNDLGAGGTLALLHARGAHITYLTVTDDLVGVVDPHLPADEATAQLRSEQRTAGAVLGIDEHVWLDFPDAGPYDYYALRRALVACIRRLRPDFLFTCDPWLPYEAHLDHINTGRAVAEASFLQAMPRLASDPQVDREYQPYTIQGVAFYFSRQPNTTVDISTAWERKHRAAACYQAQFTPEQMDGLQTLLELEERACAKGQPYEFAEAFKVLAPAQLHVNLHA